MSYPEILHHGATQGVTGSCHQLLMDAQHSLLIDCGLFQGAETSAEGRAGAGSLAIDFALDTVKALIATHVHVDHVGRIPYLLAAGFKGRSSAASLRPGCCPSFWKMPSSWA